MPDVVQSRYPTDLPNNAEQLLPPTTEFPKFNGTVNDEDTYANALKQVDSNAKKRSITDALNVPFASALTPALRYEDPEIGYHPFDTKLEYKYADAHPWKNLANNVIQFGARFGGAFVESIATIPLAVNAAFNQDFSKLYDNDLTNGITDWLDSLNNSLPVYTSEFEENHPVLKYLNPLKFHSFLGAWGGAINNLGYTAGAIAGALVEDALIGLATGGSGLPAAFAANGAQLLKGTAKLGSAVAKGEEVSNMLVKSSLSAERALVRTNELANVAQETGSVIRAEGTGMFQAAGSVDDLLATGTHARQAAVNRMYNFAKIRDGIRYHLGLLTSATAEGAFEAAEVYHRGVDELKQEFYDRYGRDPQRGEELDNINKTAKQASDITMGANIALLYVSNRVNWGSLFKPTSNAMFTSGIKGWGKNIARVTGKGELVDVLDNETKKAIGKKILYDVVETTPKSRIGRMLLRGEKALKIGSRSINEAIEEGSQFTFSEGTLDYAKSKYDPYAMNDAASLWEGIKSGFDKTINTNEGWDNMVGGFIGGMLGGGVMSKINKQPTVSEQISRQVKMLNSFNLNGTLQERFKAAIAQNVIAGKYQEAIDANDMFAAKNMHYDMLFNWVNSGVKANSFDKRMTELDMLKGLTGQDFQDKWGMEDTEENRAKADEYLEGLRTKAQAIKANVDKVQYITKNPFQPSDANNYGAYESYKDELAHNLSAFTEYKDRINQMKGELQARFPMMDVAQAVNLTSIQGMSTILQQINKANESIAKQLNELEQVEDTADAQNELKNKRKALDSIYERLQKIVYSGNTQTSQDSVTGEQTITGRTDDVQFNGDDYISALNDLFDLYNGASFEQNKYIERQAQQQAQNGEQLYDITELQNDYRSDDDVKADLLEKLQDIYKLTEANYNIGKYYTYLRKGKGMTDFMQRIKEIADQALTTINQQRAKNYTQEREEAIREEEYLGMDEEDPESTKEEPFAETEEATMRKAAEKVVKKQKLNKDEEDVVAKHPKKFTKYVKTERIIQSRLKEEGLVNEGTGEPIVTDEDGTPKPPPITPNGIDPFVGIHPRNLFGMFSQDRNNSKMRTNLYNVIFKNNTSVAGVVGNLTATFTSEVEPSDTKFVQIPGTKLWRQPFQENLTIYHNGEIIGILRPVDGVFLDAEGNRSVYDMTSDEYTNFTGNQKITYDEFMNAIKAQRDAYNKLKDSIKNSGQSQVDIDTITNFFDLEINHGTRVQSLDPKADVKLGQLNSVPVGSFLVSLDANGNATIVNSAELNAKQLKEAQAFIEENKDQIGNTFRYMLVVPILGKYRKIGVIVARNAETTKDEKEEFATVIKKVASGALSVEQANEILGDLTDKYYITASRENAGTYIDFRFDDEFNPYVRVFNREKQVITEIMLDKTQVQAINTYQELTKLINDSIRTQEGRESSITGNLKGLKIRLKGENLKRQIPDNDAVQKLSDLNDVVKVATSSKDIFEKFTIHFDPRADVAQQQVVTPEPVAPQPIVPEPVAPAPAETPVQQTIEPVAQEQTDDLKYAKNKTALIDLLKNLFNLTVTQARETANIFGQVAKEWAARTGEPIENFFKEIGFSNQAPTGSENILDQNLRAVENVIKGFELTPKYDNSLFVGFTKQGLAGENLLKGIDRWITDNNMPVRARYNKTYGTVELIPTATAQGTLFQIIGEKGAANLEEADTILDGLNTAKTMETEGKFTPLQIRLATGWEKNGDGKWRYEIEDNNINKQELEILVKQFQDELQQYEDEVADAETEEEAAGLVEPSNSFNLGEILNNSDLLKAYPELAEYTLVIANLGSSGSYNNSKKTIKIDGSREIEPLYSTLIHEIQHAVQNIEGFNTGANVKKFQKEETRTEEKINLLHKQREDAIDSNNLKLANELQAKILELQSQIVGSNSAYSKYRRVSGEVEARNVEARANLSTYDRLEKTLQSTEDVAEESKIYINNKLDTVNQSVEPVLQTAIDAANKADIKGYTSTIIKEAANTDPSTFVQYLRDINDQATDPLSRQATIDTYGQELVDAAKAVAESDLLFQNNEDKFEEKDFKVGDKVLINRYTFNSIHLNEYPLIDLKEPVYATVTGRGFRGYVGVTIDGTLETVHVPVKNILQKEDVVKQELPDAKSKEFKDLVEEILDNISYVGKINSSVSSAVYASIYLEKYNFTTEHLNELKRLLKTDLKDKNSYGTETLVYVITKDIKKKERPNDKSENDYEVDYISGDNLNEFVEKAKASKNIGDIFEHLYNLLNYYTVEDDLIGMLDSKSVKAKYGDFFEKIFNKYTRPIDIYKVFNNVENKEDSDLTNYYIAIPEMEFDGGTIHPGKRLTVKDIRLIASAGPIENVYDENGRTIQRGVTVFKKEYKPNAKFTAEEKAEFDKMLDEIKNDSNFFNENKHLLNQKAKGAYDTIKKIIYSLSNPDVSTPVHELAHYWHGITSGENKNTNLTDEEVQQVLDWAGHKTWTRETSEAFAKGFETYLTEGNSTNNKGLDSIFDKFAKWLAELYNNIKEALGIELNDEMRSIYSRMLNSEYVKPEVKETIEQAQQNISLSINTLDGQSYTIDILNNGELAGSIDAFNDGTNLTINDAQMIVPRQGIGIEAYRQLAKEAQNMGLTLQSDKIKTRLSDAAIGLWEKLVANGEAIKGKDNYVYQNPTTEQQAEEAPVEQPKRKRTRVRAAEKIDLSAYEYPEKTEAAAEEETPQAEEVPAPEPEVIPVQHVSYTTTSGETAYGTVTDVDGTLLTIATLDGGEIFRSASKVNNVTPEQYEKAKNNGELTYKFTSSKGVVTETKYTPKYKEGQYVKDVNGKDHQIESVELVPKENTNEATIVYNTVDGVRLDESGVQRRVYITGQDQLELKKKYSKQLKNIDNIVAKLSQFFGGIQYEYVELPFTAPARFYKGVVQINLNNIEQISRNSDEILIHEFVHPFVHAMKSSNNKLYNNLVADLNANYKDVIEEAKTYYKESDYTAADLTDEALTLHLGRSIAQAFKNITRNPVTDLLYSDLTVSKDLNEFDRYDVLYHGEVIGEISSPTDYAELQNIADDFVERTAPEDKLRRSLYVKFRNWFNNIIDLIKKQKSVRTLDDFVKEANQKQTEFRFVVRSNLNSAIELEQNGTSYITVNIDPSVKNSYDVHNLITITNRLINEDIAGSDAVFTDDVADRLQFTLETYFYGSKQSVNLNDFTVASINEYMTLEELSQFIAKQFTDHDIISNITFTPQEQDAFDELEAYFNLTDPQLQAMRKRIEGKFNLLEETAKKRLNSDTLNIQAGAAYNLSLDSKDDLEFMLKYMENAAVSINMAYVKYGKIIEKLNNNKGTLSRAELSALNKEFAVLRQLLSYYDQFSSYTQFEDYLGENGQKGFAYYAKAFANQQRMREGMQDVATKLAVEWLTPYAEMHTKLMKEQGYTDEKYEITYDKLYELFKYGTGRDTNYVTFWLGSNVTSRDPVNAIFANTLSDMLSINNIEISRKADNFTVAFSEFLKEHNMSIGDTNKHQQYFKDNYMRKAKIKMAYTDPVTGEKSEIIKEKWALHQQYKFDEYELDLQAEMAKYKNPRSGAEADLFKAKLEDWKKANNYGKSAKYLNDAYTKLAGDKFFKAMETVYDDSNKRYGTNQLRFGIIPQKFEISYTEKLKRAAELFKGDDKLANVSKGVQNKLGGGQNRSLQYNLDGSVYRNINTTLSTIKEEENISTRLDEIFPAFIVESNNYSTLKETEYNAETLMLLLEGNTKLGIAPRTFAQEDFNAKINQPAQLKAVNDRIEILKAQQAANDPAFDPELLKKLEERAAKGIQSYNLWDKLSNRFKPSTTNYNNEMLIGMIKDRYYGESVEDVKVGKISATKAAHYLRLYTSINNMAGNYVAGIGNITIGNLQLFIEAHGGKYITKTALAKATADYALNLPEYIKDLQRPIKSKDTQLSIMLDAIQGEIEDEFGERVSGNIARKMFRTSTLFLFTRAGEHQIQLTNMKAMMLTKEVETNAGEKINLYEAFVKDKDGRYSLRKDVKFTQEDLTKFIRDMHGVNRMLNGNYSTLHKTVLQRKWYGNLLLSYRKYLYPTIRARYASEHVDFERNTVEVGYLRYFMGYLLNGTGNLIKSKGKKGFMNWKDMKPHQQYAMRKTAAELGAFASLTAMGIAFFGSGDDEKKVELTDAQKFGALMLFRLASDLGMYHIYMPSETLRQLKSPTASLQTVVGVVNVLKQMVSNPFEEYTQDYGTHKAGDSKLEAKTLKLVPIVSKLQSSLDDKLGYYDLLGRNVGSFVEGVANRSNFP